MITRVEWKARITFSVRDGAGYSSRTGVVYFPRIREKSIFNFLIKTTMSGVASSVGAKNNKKYLKQYRREREKYNLPPIEINGH